MFRFRRPRPCRLLAAVLCAIQSLALVAAQPEADRRFNQGKLSKVDEMIEAMCELSIHVDVLLIQSAAWQHKVLVFVYPISDNHVWAWDNHHKSLALDAEPGAALAIANTWVAAVAPGEIVTNATFEQSKPLQRCAADRM